MIVLSLALLLYGYLYINSLSEYYGTKDSRGAEWHSGSFTVIRLTPEEDLKQAILAFTKAHKLAAATIVSVVGSVKSLRLRLASPPKGQPLTFYETTDQNYEIVSFVGTMEYNASTDSSYGHFHMSVADEYGHVFGGHLMEGCRIHTTAEISIMSFPQLQFHRVYDLKTKYAELLVSESNGYYLTKFLRTYKKGFGILFRYLQGKFCVWHSIFYADGTTSSCPATW